MMDRLRMKKYYFIVAGILCIPISNDCFGVVQEGAYYLPHISISLLKCESKFRVAEEDSGEAEFTPAQKPNEAATFRCKENPQALRLYQPTQG